MAKFCKGDRVRVQTLPGSYICHPQNVNGTVVYNYRERYDCGADTDYCIDIDGSGQVSWFPEEFLTAISQAGA